MSRLLLYTQRIVKPYKKLSQLLFFALFNAQLSKKVIVQLSFRLYLDHVNPRAIHNPNIITVKIFSSTPLPFFNISGFFSYRSFLIISFVSSTSVANYHSNLIIIRHQVYLLARQRDIAYMLSKSKCLIVLEKTRCNFVVEMIQILSN